ncbi:helicase SRCAP isoform X3 [Rhinoderma darwinii]|uniref:helicase SRCAP isoform X3 n=1 Tax=Rhinoderma darwinii TaxID=43563 RepID=UPI003F681033
MEPCAARRQMPASDVLTSVNPPNSPDSSGELSPFDLSGDIGDICPGSPTDDGLDGNQQDGSAGQKWDNHTEIAEQAKHEAEIENRIAELRKEGFWTPRRLSKFPEPTRPKVHWDYLCEEMQWLSADFGQERRWKRNVARKVVRMVVRHHEELKQKEERARREEQAKLRRIATSIAKEVRQFWSNVEKVVQFKQQSRLEEKRKKALDLQLDFIVGQTEKYSDLLSQSLSEAIPVSKTSSSCVGSSQGGSLRTSPAPSICQKAAGDGDFLPREAEDEEDDDEETIEIEEQQEGNDAEAHRLELELLKQESELPLDELLQNLPPQVLQDDSPNQDPVSSNEDTDEEEEEAEEKVEEEDDEFTANEDEAEDEEDTIAAEEEMAGRQDHAKELSQLATEGEMSLDELLLKYSVLPSEQENASQSEHESAGTQEDYDSSGCDSSDCESDGVEFLVKLDEDDPGSDRLQHEPPETKKEITDIAATAESLQPKGYTLATTQVKTAVPFLLRGDLREYQHIGLEWLVTMYEKKLNGILADEMGLGKTIQTISLLAHLACERGNWGPHLIIVPTSVILNWEMELKRWCPSFKILTYYGSQKERKLKRQGWTKANAFHVCITSYKLVLQDHQAFRRKNWKYLILDEAQNIKNFKSQRWQSLLNFNSQRRLLLTGTPLQNSLMELWSLMHFLMPHVFQSHREFKEWFSNPLTGMIEGSQEYNEGLVRRLHKVLRPFLLRRIKVDVEKQMPKKYEHVIYCRLSMRQRFLYDDFMSQAATRETLASGHFMSVINILMQLRKVCNHPNLFDPRPIHSPFITRGICYTVPSLVLHALQRPPLENLDMSMFDLINMEGRVSRYERDVFLPQYKQSRSLIQEIVESPEPPPRPRPLKMKVNRMLQPVKPDPRSVVVVNNSRPVQKCPDVLPSPTPQTAAPPPLTSSPCTVSAPPAPALRAPLPVQSCPPTTSGTPMSNGAGKAIPVQTVPPMCSAPQRLILTPDMQARLPSGEVISLAQLASLGGRPLQSQSVTKPLTLQLQGAKLTLSGTQVRPLGVGQPRPMLGNVLHLVSSGGQHHLLSQPAQLALIQALAQQVAASPAQPMPQLVHSNAGVQALSVQSLQHTLLNSASLPAVSPGQAAAGMVKIVVRQSSREIPASPQCQPATAPVRPLLRVVPGPSADHSAVREGTGEQRAAPVVSTSTLTLTTSPLLMMSSPALTARLSSPNPAQPMAEEPPVSGVALRLLTTSAAVQLTNHHSSPRLTQPPALLTCSPAPAQNFTISNCTSAHAACPDTALSAALLKAVHNPDGSGGSLDTHYVHNGNVPLRSEPTAGQASQCVTAPTTSADTTLYVNLTQNSPSPTSSMTKMAPATPTYNLSLVPALLANSAPATVSSPYPIPTRFLTSPLSLLTLSPLTANNGGPTPVLYTPPSASAFPAASVAAPLPLLAAPVPFTAPLPVSSPTLSSLPASLSVDAPSQNPRAVVSMPSPIMSVSGPGHLSTPTGSPLPLSSVPAAPVSAAASMLETPVNQPFILSPDPAPVPLLEASASDSLPPMVLNTSLKLPSVASCPLMAASGSIPLLAASAKVPIINAPSAPPAASPSSRVLSVPPASPLPLLATTGPSCYPASSHSILLPAPIALASLRHSAPVTSLTFTTCGSVSSVASSPLSFTSPPLPDMITTLPSDAHAMLSADAQALLPPAVSVFPALEPADVSPLVSSVQPLISGLSPAPLTCLSLRIPAPQSSFSLSTQSPMMPASAPVPMPSMPASTPMPSPLFPASTPMPSPLFPASTPMPSPLFPASTPLATSSLPASSFDPASLLLVPSPAPDLSSMSACAQPLDPTSLLPPPSATHPLVISFSAPLTLTASSPSLGVSAHSHVPLLTAPMLQSPAATALLPTVSAKPVPLSSSPGAVTAAPSAACVQAASTTTYTKPPPASSARLSASAQEPSLSLSVADPPSLSVTLGSASESDNTTGDDPRPSYNAALSTCVKPRRQLPPPPRSPFYLEPLEERRRKQKLERLERIFHLNERRSALAPVYGTEVLRVCSVQPARQQTCAVTRCSFTAEQRLEQLAPVIERFIFAMPPVEAPQITLHTSHPPPSLVLEEQVFKDTLSQELTPHTRCLHRIISNMRTQFPDLRLIQYDCGKLQTLDRLLRQLKSGGHRVLLFTQMTRMLDVLEQFLNYHGHIYLRLDGSTRVEQRQVLMERFNMDRRIFCFILSTRSGGVGVNLTGADTVIFYDSDWNPTMDAQAQDRCHRIGQTRDVHIYRLVSERTVEENILKKAQQKRLLGDMAIEGGNFTTAYFKQHTIRELFDMEDAPRKEAEVRNASPDPSTEDGATSRQAHILEQALCGAEDEEDTLAASLVRAEQVADLAEFNENVPLEPEEEEQSRAEQEISALVEQLTPIERYAMYYLEASIEEVSKEELKQAEEQVEAARKDLFLAKDEVGLITEEKWDEDTRRNRKVKTPVPNRTHERVGVRMSERLRGSRPTESVDLAESPTIPDTAPPSQKEEEVHDRSNPATPEPEAVCPSAETMTNLTLTMGALTPSLPPSSLSEKDTVVDFEPEKEDAEVIVTENVAGTEPVPGSPVGAEAVPGSPVGAEAVPGSPVGAETVPGSPVGAEAVPGSPVGAEAVPGSPVGAEAVPGSPVGAEAVPGSPVGAEAVPGSPVGAEAVPGSPVGAEAVPGSPVGAEAVPGSPVGAEAVPGSPVGAEAVPGSPVGAEAVPGSPVGAEAVPGSPVGAEAVPGSPVGAEAVPGSPVGAEAVPGSPVGAEAVPGSPVGVEPVRPVGGELVPGSPVGAEPVSPVGAEPVSPVGAVPGSPVGAEPEEPALPRTPRRKVFADSEITLAGATEASPTAKVLRRLPGRLVTVVEERLPTPRRQIKGRGPQPVTEKDCQNPTPELHSPSHDRISEETSETGSPPPKRKRGRPPKSRADMSPTSVPVDVTLVDASPHTSPDLDTALQGATRDLVTSAGVQRHGSPNFPFKVNSDSESGSPIEKRKRGRPPKKREVSPIVGSPASPKRLEAPPCVASPASLKTREEPLFVPSLSSKKCVDPIDVASLTSSMVLHRDSAPEISKLDTKQGNSSSISAHGKFDHKLTDSASSAALGPSADLIIPSESSNIPVVPAEGTSSSGVEEPVSPPKRKRGRPPKPRPVLKVNSSPVFLNDTLDSSPERSPSPQVTRTSLQRKCKPLKAETLDMREQSSSLADTDDSSDEEVTVRIPLTRSARTRLQTTSQVPPAISSKSPRGRSPRGAPIEGKPLNKKRKPASASPPSPPSSPHGSSSESRKRPCPPAERVLRSSLTANPASNTRSSRSPLLNSPNSHRGRKAKT